MKNEIDSHKLMYHLERVAQWKKEGDCFPIYVEIGPTNRCNHRCTFCALDWLKHGGADINKEVMLKTLEDMGNSGVRSTMFAGEGEPLLHEDISKFIQHAKQSGIDVALTTNGVLFDEQKAEDCLPYISWMRFSVDAGTKETYAKVHKTKPEDFDRVIKNLRTAIEIRDKTNLKASIGVQFLLIPENSHEVIKLTEIVKGAGADNIQVKPYSQHPLSQNRISADYHKFAKLEDELMLFNSERFKVFYRKQTMERLESGRDYNECRGLSFFALVNAKGEVIPCNLFYNNPEFVYGNINKQSFSEIWKSQRRQDVIRKVREMGIGACREACRLDPINRYLERLKNPMPTDSFI